MKNEILSALEKASESNDPDGLEYAINLAWKSGMRREYVDILNVVLNVPWHYRHEDVVNALQKLKDPKSIDALFQAATTEYEYLLYDEERSLARKCTWALADIGTPESKSKLELLSESSNPYISKYATKRLQRWDSELHRKTI